MNFHTCIPLRPLVAAACLVGAAGVSSAQSGALDPPTIPLNLTAQGDGSFAAAISRSVEGLFVDSFDLTPPIGGSVNVSFAAASGAPLNFFAVQLGNESFGFEEGTTAFSFAAEVDGGEPLVLTVFGFAGDLFDLTPATASYTGSVVAAIPEPQTYALMLAGIGVVAWASARRRRQRAG